MLNRSAHDFELIRRDPNGVVKTSAQILRRELGQVLIDRGQKAFGELGAMVLPQNPQHVRRRDEHPAMEAVGKRTLFEKCGKRLHEVAFFPLSFGEDAAASAL